MLIKIILIILFIVLGLLFIFLEFFLTSAAFAILGSIFVCLSLVAFAITCPIVWWSMGYLVATALAVIGVCKGALWWIKSSKRRGEFYLQDDQEGYSASFFDHNLLGKQGKALTELKTSGHVLIAEKSYQALSESGFIVKDASIIVTGGKGAYLIVKEMTDG